jgi:hypothetical protein
MSGKQMTCHQLPLICYNDYNLCFLNVNTGPMIVEHWYSDQRFLKQKTLMNPQRQLIFAG